MSTSHYKASVESTDSHPGGTPRPSSFGNTTWSGLNIIVLVLGFVFFWPLGLFLLYWIVSGRQVHELPGVLKRQWSRWFGNRSDRDSAKRECASDNNAFNAFQQQQIDRIASLKKGIEERTRRFQEYRENSRRRADQEELDRFLAESTNLKQGSRVDG